MTEQIPAETQARWQAAIKGYELEPNEHVDGGFIFKCPDGIPRLPFNIYDSDTHKRDTALIDAVELAASDAPKRVTGKWFVALTNESFTTWRAAATAAVESAIREWERNGT